MHPFEAESGLPVFPESLNEPVLSYAPGSAERAELKQTLSSMAAECMDLPCIIGGHEVRTGRLEAAEMPNDHQHVIGQAHLAGDAEIGMAIDAAQQAWADWSRWPWTQRAAVFQRAAALLAGPWRQRLNASTMLGQGKTVHQAEVDSACELIDFWRYNTDLARKVYAEQPQNADGAWTRIDYRPLEGFVYAATPFNFTAIAGNLPSAPAMMGNTVLWKPSAAAKHSAFLIMKLLEAAGLPPGVINLVYGDAPQVTDQVLRHPDLAGVHFTGSTQVFSHLLQQAYRYSHRSIPRVVGETGGKNFVLAHPSAAVEDLCLAIIRGAFEYQGQKCSAASRLFIPRSLWPALKEQLCAAMASIPMGDVRDFSNFMGAVIHEGAWTRHDAALREARDAAGIEILAGGQTNRDTGYFVQPTLLQADDPGARYMTEEFFGPISCAYVYDDAAYSDVLRLIDGNSAYGLTGSIFANERSAILEAQTALRYAAGNLYINDKPTGAMVGQQPFGGSRASGTNDKAGSMWNMSRWTSPRAIKETWATPRGDYAYPFMAND